MGLLNRLLGKPASASAFVALEAVADSVTRLRLFLGMRLLDFYSQTYGDETNFLCAAILNYVAVEEPSNDQAKRYKAQNHVLVEREATKLHSQMPDIEKVLSYLYAAECICLGTLMHTGRRAQL